VASRDDLAALLRKYEEIRRLRVASRGDPTADPRDAMAELAREFPGALREADDLPPVDLEARIAALRGALDGSGATARWMQATARFHALARGALSAKRWLRGRRSAGGALALLEEHELATHPFPEDARDWRDDLARVASPPGGRLTALVFDRLAVELGAPVAVLRLEVFGPRWRPARRRTGAIEPLD